LLAATELRDAVMRVRAREEDDRAGRRRDRALARAAFLHERLDVEAARAVVDDAHDDRERREALAAAVVVVPADVVATCRIHIKRRRVRVALEAALERGAADAREEREERAGALQREERRRALADGRVRDRAALSHERQ